MSPTRILLLGAATLLLYLAFRFAFPYALRAVFARLDVGYDTAVAGRVTGHWQSQQEHGFFLDGQHRPSYDFRAFVPAPTAAQHPPGGPATPDENRVDLDRYLHKGDFLRKPAHSRTLTVRRGESLSQWVYAPAEATP